MIGDGADRSDGLHTRLCEQICWAQLVSHTHTHTHTHVTSMEAAHNVTLMLLLILLDPCSFQAVTEGKYEHKRRGFDR